MLSALAAIVGIFVILLVVKAVAGFRLCVLCASVSGTWIALLALYHGGYYTNETVIALLIGQSIVGLLYFLRDHFADPYSVFTLPFLLTGTIIGYMLLVTDLLPLSLGVVGSTWVIAGVLFAYRKNDRIAVMFDAVIACCRDW